MKTEAKTYTGDGTCHSMTPNEKAKEFLREYFNHKDDHVPISRGEVQEVLTCLLELLEK